MNFIAKALLTVVGSGLSPFAPGTAGSLVSAVLLWPFLVFCLSLAMLGWLAYGGVLLLVVWCSLFLIKKFVQKPFDKSWIVIDELAGMMVSLLPLLYFGFISLELVIAAFIFFRFFDILKPFGIKAIDQKGTPESVVYDDLLAGLYAALCLVLLIVGWQLF